MDERTGEDIKEIVLPPSLLYHRPKNTRLRGALGEGRGESGGEGRGKSGGDSEGWADKARFFWRAKKRKRFAESLVGALGASSVSVYMADVTDPTDWPRADFGQLDRLLRCTVCYDFFAAPVILTSCSHSCTSLGSAGGPGPLGLLSKGRWAC